MPDTAFPCPSAPTRRALVWFRRDLRDFDHAALYHALSCCRATSTAAFVFDREILDALPRATTAASEFIRESVAELDAALARRGGGLIVCHGAARATRFPQLARELRVQRRVRQSRLRARRHARATATSRRRSPPTASRITTSRTR